MRKRQIDCPSVIQCGEFWLYLFGNIVDRTHTPTHRIGATILDLFPIDRLGIEIQRDRELLYQRRRDSMRFSIGLRIDASETFTFSTVCHFYSGIYTYICIYIPVFFLTPLCHKNGSGSKKPMHWRDNISTIILFENPLSQFNNDFNLGSFLQYTRNNLSQRKTPFICIAKETTKIISTINKLHNT